MNEKYLYKKNQIMSLTESARINHTEWDRENKLESVSLNQLHQENQFESTAENQRQKVSSMESIMENQFKSNGINPTESFI